MHATCGMELVLGHGVGISRETLVVDWRFWEIGSLQVMTVMLIKFSQLQESFWVVFGVEELADTGEDSDEHRQGRKCYC